MNTQVTATGIQVTAKSNNTFLFIGIGEIDTASEIQGTKAMTVALTSFADGLPATTGTATTVKDAVKVLVVSGSNMVTLDKDTTLNTPISLHTADQTLTDSMVVQVDIYIYYDGSVDSVYTNNIAHLIGATFGLEFGVEVVSAT